MKTVKNVSIAAALMAAALTSGAMQAQEGPTNTQMLVTVDSKVPVVPEAANLKLELNGKLTTISSIERVTPNGTQIAILIDDGLRFSVGSDLDLIKKFITSLPAATQVMVGYMSNGTVRSPTPFTTDHESVAAAIRLPLGRAGLSGSPYFALSDFTQRWGAAEAQAQGPQLKARFVLMVTNGVDLYNGSTSVLNQNSPYVQRAIEDSQRAGIGISSIYYGDAGIRGARASFSGQSYLQQLADATGGRSYYEGTGNPVSLLPFLDEFSKDLSDTFVATFQVDAGGGNGKPQLVRTKLTATPKLKLRHPDLIRPGNQESPGQPGQ